MHVNFADWYSICTTGTETNLTEALLISRWQGIEELAKAPEILELVRATLQRPSADRDYLGTFRQAFKDADVTFLMSGNDLEVSVLAGTLLSEILNREALDADQASLGLLCAVGIGMHRPQWIDPFIHNAETYLGRRLRTLRAQVPPAMLTFSAKDIKTHADSFAVKLAENQQPQTSEAAKVFFEVLVGLPK
jgi:hypothetical protein